MSFFITILYVAEYSREVVHVLKGNPMEIVPCIE